MNYKKFEMLQIGEVLPEGWLKRQLEIQAEGLSGRLHDCWDSVGTYSGWLGGTGENWERGPYFLDGILPLAYYLEDERLYSIAEKFIKWTLESQDEKGNFGPLDSKQDWWSRMVMLKVLVQYYEITKKDEILRFMHRYFKYQLKCLEENPLRDWGRARCADLLYCIKWLYEREPEKYLEELAAKVLEQGDDWNEFFENLPFTRPTEYYYDWKSMEKMSRDVMWETMQFHHTHIVNVTMGIKYPAMASWVRGKNQSESLRNGIISLKKYHGVVTGAFNGDEHLAGNDPSRGAELCSIAEYMFSLQVVLEIFGDTKFADLLERLAYNAYPAMFTEDYMGHQYLQQANQVAATNEPRAWYNNLEDSNTFGLEPNFGCCTANMHQGWPKLVKSLWLKEEAGIVSMIFAPNELKTKVHGEDVWIEVVTEYPAELNVKYIIRKAGERPFSLKIRIPGWCRTYELQCNGKSVQHVREEGNIKLYRSFSEGEVISICFHAEVRESYWYHNSMALERGPLVFALDMEEKWRTFREHAGINDYEVVSESAWNYALVKGEKVEVEEMPCRGLPFQKSHPPVVLRAKAKRLEGWKMEAGNTGDLPFSPVESDAKTEEIRLIPFGCTHLRIAQFPYCEV